MTVTVGLRFTDGTTTVTISNGSTGWVLEYAPKNERADVEQVTEKSRAMLLGGLSTVRGNIESINKLFQQAKVYQLERTGAVVYIERQLDTGDAWWRSELVEAVPLPGPEALDGDHINGKYQVVVDLKYFCGFSFEEIAAMKNVCAREFSNVHPIFTMQARAHPELEEQDRQVGEQPF